jgi:hypothetical protein
LTSIGNTFFYFFLLTDIFPSYAARWASYWFCEVWL